MGINSTEVSYGFGQLGSAITDNTANPIKAPKGMAIVAITALEAATFNATNGLVSEDPTMYINTDAASNSTGTYTRTVDGPTSSSQTVVFAEENAGTNSNDNIEVGDEIYVAAVGASLGTVSAIDVGSNTKTITFSGTAVSLGDGITISFIKPEGIPGYKGVGGLEMDASDSIPAGVTIYGRWTELKLAGGRVIAYFGE